MSTDTRGTKHCWVLSFPFLTFIFFYFFFKEELALQLINNLQHEPQRYQHSYFRNTIILILALLLVRAR